jgi:hypothetical protein
MKTMRIVLVSIVGAASFLSIAQIVLRATFEHRIIPSRQLLSDRKEWGLSRGGCIQKALYACPEEIVACTLFSCDEETQSCPQAEMGYQNNHDTIVVVGPAPPFATGYKGAKGVTYLCGWFSYCTPECVMANGFLACIGQRSLSDLRVEMIPNIKSPRVECGMGGGGVTWWTLGQALLTQGTRSRYFGMVMLNNLFFCTDIYHERQLHLDLRCPRQLDCSLLNLR